MNEGLTWQQPQVVWEWKRREAWRLFRHFWVVLTKAVWGLWALVVLPVAYFWGDVIYPVENFGRWFGNLVLIGLLAPSLFAVVVMIVPPFLLSGMLHKKGCRYELSPKGAFRHGWQEAVAVGWKRVETYRFADHPELEGIRVLEFKVKVPKMLAKVATSNDALCGFEFDPRMTSESEMDAVIRRYLAVAQPSK